MFARAFARAATRSATPRPATTNAIRAAALRRAALSTAAPSGGSSKVPIAIALIAASAGAYYYGVQSYPAIKQSAEQAKADKAAAAAVEEAPKEPEPLDYRKVAADIAELLDDVDYDDGSYGPVFVRLAWHASGTYNKADGTGGSNGATMRFGPEAGDGANAGLDVARNRLEPIKAKYPQISYADLWTLAGVVAIKEMGGPSIPWKAGRTDAVSAESCPPQGRLPDASKDRKHVREVFNRMGFDDREIVALMGAHVLGRCHPDRSGYHLPWTYNPTTFTNAYYTLLQSEYWKKEKNWDGPMQYVNKKGTGDIMMLPTDMEMLWDRTFKQYVKEFANDEQVWFDAFSSAFKKLLELGVQFPAEAQDIVLE
ncbi:L-ascorbate peroxidase 3 [Allomyces javanicus]|nr:L-ascorbate peroxidase 3 [Allomyces javanicus]